MTRQYKGTYIAYMQTAQAATTIEFSSAIGIDVWVPANGGCEQAFIARSGARLQYMWNGLTGDHAYLDLDADVILDDASAARHIGV